MDSSRLTMSFLESLSTDELLGLAVKSGLDIPDGLDRVFIISELMEMNREARINRQTVPENREEFSELSPLPRNYNKTFIDVLIRDPLWAFVFWEISEHDRKNCENSADFDGYFLMIVPCGDNGSSLPADSSFVIAIDKKDSTRYLGFPPDGSRNFYVELCATVKEKKSALAVTAPFTMPKLIDPVSAAHNPAEFPGPLAKLSGTDKFTLTHSVDRRSRIYGSRASDSGYGGA